MKHPLTTKILFLTLFLLTNLSLLFAADTCDQIGTGFKFKGSKKLKDYITKVNEALDNRNARILEGMFSKRLKISQGKLRRILKAMNVSYGHNWKVIPYRVWKVSSTKASYIDCGEVEVANHYGYQSTVGVWVQLSGTRHAGRLYYSVVEKDGHFQLGSFHAQQWSYLELDPYGWLQRAQESLKKNVLVKSYVELDISEKLLHGAGYFRLKEENQIKKIKSDISMPVVLEHINKNLSEKAIYLNSVMSEAGPVLLLRFIVKRDVTHNVLKKKCDTIAPQVFKIIDKSFTGLKCSFNYAGERKEVEGRLGSRIVRRSK